MDRPVRWFLRSAVVWLGIGMAFGITMGVSPGYVGILRTPHLHALLPGFVLMMIFGVAYHVLPRFAGKMVPWRAGPMVHVVLANLGLLLLVSGFLLRIRWPAVGQLLIPGGGILIMTGAALFIHTVWHLTGLPMWRS